MIKKKEWRRTTWGQRISVIWILFFTGAAFASDVLIRNGVHAIATPSNAYLPPFISSDHLFGTDQLGRDVLLYLILSCRTAWLLTVPPLLLATCLGTLLGTGAAFIGNSGISFSLKQVIYLLCLGLIPFMLYPYLHWSLPAEESNIAKWIISSICFTIAIVILFKKNHRKPGTKYLAVAFDDGLQKVINIWSTLPKLLLLLIFSALSTFSMYSMMGWIFISYWVLPARIARARSLQLKKEAYFETAQTLGLPFPQIFKTFIWPSLKSSILTGFCFAASGLLGIGSTLAYLGIGLPTDVPSWGKMLSTARFSIEAWWLIVFPAAFLLFSIFSFQSLGNLFATSFKKLYVTNSDI